MEKTKSNEITGVRNRVALKVADVECRVLFSEEKQTRDDRYFRTSEKKVCCRFSYS